MKQPKMHCSLINRYADPTVVASRLSEVTNVSLQQVPFIKTIPCLETVHTKEQNNVQEYPFPVPVKDSTGVCSYYLMDAASVLAVEALGVKKGDKVLDLCAAPAGKSVAILQKLLQSETAQDGQVTRQTLNGELVANELNPTRFKRLKNVIQDYLPEPQRQQVNCISLDGTQIHNYYGMKAVDESELFDKILVDAPCSSERHIVHSIQNNMEAISGWQPSMSKNLSDTQVNLVVSALQCLKVGGYLLYATCSISNIENDDVIRRVLKKIDKLKVDVHSHKMRIDVSSKKWASGDSKSSSLKWSIGNPTQYGWIVLPNDKTLDNRNGYGPLYFALLKRKN
ncbi:hypothetical protein MP228_010395 [Amoeboaphelidium protococcarum]|nr:hypothetical protein MP228_010395 [Amoeboaphelidium protococcarum]